jgi:hypothetical protein
MQDSAFINVTDGKSEDNLSQVGYMWNIFFDDEV